jgi:hypothetical protein
MTERPSLRGLKPSATLDELPDVLTVAEAARLLRISRGAAYELARQWRESGGLHGLPVVVLGRTLRVPAPALRDMLAAGRATAHASGS